MDSVVQWRALVEYSNDEMDHLEAFHPRKAGKWLQDAEQRVRAAAKSAGRLVCLCARGFGSRCKRERERHAFRYEGRKIAIRHCKESLCCS